jgi:hypothetical protein
MKTETEILNNYIGLLDNLNPKLKLKLIERLSKSVKDDISWKNDNMEKSFGTWKDSKDTEEIISEIRNSRSFSRKIESF